MLSEHEIEVTCVWLEHRRIICTFVIDLARLAGFRPSKRQPLPGTKKIWQACRIHKEGLNAINAWEELKTNDRLDNG